MKIDKQNKKAQPVVPAQKKSKTKTAKLLTIEDLVNGNPNFQFIGNGKIKCKLTNHEMAGTVENFQTYIKSKSYKRGIQGQFDITEYEEILVPHKQGPQYLYCQLTGAKVAKKKSAIDKHVQGRKFVKALQQLKKMQQQGSQAEASGEQILNELAQIEGQSDNQDNSQEAQDQQSKKQDQQQEKQINPLKKHKKIQKQKPQLTKQQNKRPKNQKQNNKQKNSQKKLQTKTHKNKK